MIVRDQLYGTISQIKIYGLLHDIGHTAFSHEGEDVLERYIGHHEELGKKKVINGEIGELLSENYNPKKIMELGKTKEGSIIESDVGADRMDYLKRDALNTGVAYGVIDIDRITHTLVFSKKELVLKEGGLEAAESLLLARFMMFSAVYLHSTVRIATALLYRAIINAVEDGTITADEFSRMGDYEAMDAMKKSKKAKQYVDALVQRKLYKQAAAYPGSWKTPEECKELEQRLSKELDTDIIIDYPHSFFKPINVKVMKNGRVIPITEISELIQSVKSSSEKRKSTLVLCPKKEIPELQKKLGTIE